MVRAYQIEHRMLLLLISGVLGAGLLVACDNGVAPSPSPTVTLQASASPTLNADTVETPNDGDPLTVLPLESPTRAPRAAELSQKERGQLYKLVIAALLKKEKTVYVYISPHVGEGERLDNPNEDMPVPDSLLDALSSSRDETYKLLDFSQAVGALEDGGKVKNSGVFITLGPINQDEAAKGVVTVRASIYRQRGDAEGSIYRFKRDASSGGWTLMDTMQEWSEP